MILMSMNRSEFIQIWKAWDENPGSEKTASDLVDADIEVGKRLGLSHMELRSQLSKAKSGRTYEEAVEFVMSAREATR